MREGKVAKAETVTVTLNFFLECERKYGKDAYQHYQNKKKFQDYLVHEKESIQRDFPLFFKESFRNSSGSPSETLQEITK